MCILRSSLSGLLVTQAHPHLTVMAARKCRSVCARPGGSGTLIESPKQLLFPPHPTQKPPTARRCAPRAAPFLLLPPDPFSLASSLLLPSPCQLHHAGEPWHPLQPAIPCSPRPHQRLFTSQSLPFAHKTRSWVWVFHSMLRPRELPALLRPFCNRCFHGCVSCPPRDDSPSLSDPLPWLGPPGICDCPPALVLRPPLRAGSSPQRSGPRCRPWSPSHPCLPRRGPSRGPALTPSRSQAPFEQLRLLRSSVLLQADSGAGGRKGS